MAYATAAANEYLTGISAPAVLGNVTTQTVNLVPVTAVIGVGRIGQVTESANAQVFLTGVTAIGIIGVYTIWGEVIDYLPVNWTDITDSGSPAWTDINDVKPTTWELAA